MAIERDMSRVDYCITTMERPHAVATMLRSIAVHQPEASVHVADQSEHIDIELYERLGEQLEGLGLRRRPTIHRLPFDCGVSAARNHLLEETPSEYKLIMDDDGVLTEKSDIDALVRLLDAHPNAAVAGGSVTRNGEVKYFGTMLKREGRTLSQCLASERFEEYEGIRFRQVDFLPSFLLIRKSVSTRIRWDPTLKTAGEHLDFYLNLKRSPYVALHAPDVIADHPSIEAGTHYSKLRFRGVNFLSQALEKHGVKRFKTLQGVVKELQSDGFLVTYCEL